MRIERIELHDYPPLRSIEIDAAGDIVVVAGANGAGKTRLMQAVSSVFFRPAEPLASLWLRATLPAEESAWGTRTLEIQQGKPCGVLKSYLESRTGDLAYSGTPVLLEANRIETPVRVETLSLTVPDPDEQGFSYAWFLNSVSERWENIVNYLYKKAAIRITRIANYVQAHPAKSGEDALQAFPDLSEPYRQLFTQLLPGKAMEPIDIHNPQGISYRVPHEKHPLPFATLSSGEKEIIRLAFSLVHKNINHCTIMFDEPELHVHPSLLFRFIETMKSFWRGTNQLILFTHSADLISSYWQGGNVYFLDPSASSGNQARRLSRLAEHHENVARAVSSNLGVFAVGKRLVFVEGTDSSSDRIVYARVAQSAFPEAQVVPLGSVLNLNALRSTVDEIGKAVFGVQMFLLRDRDGLSDNLIRSLEAKGHFRCLPRRHLENYLLDAVVLAEAAHLLGLSQDRQDAVQVRNALRNAAVACFLDAVIFRLRDHIDSNTPILQPARSELKGLSIERLAPRFAASIEASISDASKVLSVTSLQNLVEKEQSRLEDSLSSDAWIAMFPGKQVFRRFCGDYFGQEPDRVARAYSSAAMEHKPSVFQDITDILKQFAEVASTPLNDAPSAD